MDIFLAIWEKGHQASQAPCLGHTFIGYIAHSSMHLFYILVPSSELRQRRKSGLQYVGYECSGRRQWACRLLGSTLLRKTSLHCEQQCHHTGHDRVIGR